MTDFRFESDEIEDLELVSEFSMDGYEKYRLKTGNLTIDLAIVDTGDRDPEKYVEERKKELNDNQTEVPHPYKPEKKEEESDGNLVEFEDEPLYGKGFADPEFNLVSKDGDEIIRYYYLVTWKCFSSDKLAEIEAYIPQDEEPELRSRLKALKNLKLQHN